MKFHIFLSSWIQKVLIVLRRTSIFIALHNKNVFLRFSIVSGSDFCADFIHVTDFLRMSAVVILIFNVLISPLWKLHYTHSHLVFFKLKLWDVSQDHGEFFHKDIHSTEKRYQGRCRCLHDGDFGLGEGQPSPA